MGHGWLQGSNTGQTMPTDRTPQRRDHRGLWAGCRQALRPEGRPLGCGRFWSVRNAEPLSAGSAIIASLVLVACGIRGADAPPSYLHSCRPGRGRRRYLPCSSAPCSWHTPWRSPVRPCRPLPWGGLPSATLARRYDLYLPIRPARSSGAGDPGHMLPMLPGHTQGTRRFKKYGDHRVFVVEALGIEPRSARRPAHFVHVRSRLTQATGFADSATTYPSLISVTLSRAPSRNPALVVDALGVLGRPPLRTALRFLRPRERARCRSHV